MDWVKAHAGRHSPRLLFSHTFQPTAAWNTIALYTYLSNPSQRSGCHSLHVFVHTTTPTTLIGFAAPSTGAASYIRRYAEHASG